MKYISLFVVNDSIIPKTLINYKSFLVYNEGDEWIKSCSNSVVFDLSIERGLIFSFNNYGSIVKEISDNKFIITAVEDQFLEIDFKIIFSGKGISQKVTLTGNYDEPIYEKYQHVDLYTKGNGHKKYVDSVVWNTICPTKDYFFVSKRSGVPIIIRKNNKLTYWC